MRRSFVGSWYLVAAFPGPLSLGTTSLTQSTPLTIKHNTGCAHDGVRGEVGSECVHPQETISFPGGDAPRLALVRRNEAAVEGKKGVWVNGRVV
jgi:hypothetical protein